MHGDQCLSLYTMALNSLAFLGSIESELSTWIDLSITFQREIDGKLGRTSYLLLDMFNDYFIYFIVQLNHSLALVEFAYNSSYC